MNDIFTTSHVLLGLDVRTQDEAFAAVAAAAQRDGVTGSAAELAAEFGAREAEVSTGLVDGFAIPHAKAACARRAALYYARTVRPLPWETLDGQPVTHLLFLIAPAADVDGTHLKMLAALAACLMEDEFKAALAAAEAPEEVVRVVSAGIAGIDL